MNLESKHFKRRAKEEGVWDVIGPGLREVVHGENNGENLIKEGKYIYEYSDDSKLEISEGQDKKISIVIKKGKKQVNLESYLPRGWSIEKSEISDGFFCDHEAKLITVDKISGPKAVFSILHEIGHAMMCDQMTEAEIADHDKTLKVLGAHKIFEISSTDERLAWANAIKLARKLKYEHGINILEVFDSLEEMQMHIYTCLLTHRYTKERIMAFSSNPIKAWFKLLFEKQILSDEDMKFMEGLFDKKKLSRRFGENKK